MKNTFALTIDSLAQSNTFFSSTYSSQIGIFFSLTLHITWAILNCDIPKPAFIVAYGMVENWCFGFGSNGSLSMIRFRLVWINELKSVSRQSLVQVRYVAVVHGGKDL